MDYSFMGLLRVVVGKLSSWTVCWSMKFPADPESINAESTERIPEYSITVCTEQSVMG